MEAEMLNSLRLAVFGIAPSGRARSFFETLGLWYERDRQRRQLATLDGRFLSDIGVSPVDAAREVEKPFWRA
jgi:uncharacterized protein YjiS (DUF1127 family)